MIIIIVVVIIIIKITTTTPPPMRYKCNVDASFSETLDIVGIGMCIRDEKRAFVLART